MLQARHRYIKKRNKRREEKLVRGIIKVQAIWRRVQTQRRLAEALREDLSSELSYTDDELSDRDDGDETVDETADESDMLDESDYDAGGPTVMGAIDELQPVSEQESEAERSASEYEDGLDETMRGDAPAPQVPPRRRRLVAPGALARQRRARHDGRRDWQLGPRQRREAVRAAPAQLRSVASLLRVIG